MVEVGYCLGGNGVCAGHAKLEHRGDKLRLVLPSAEQGAEVRPVVPDQVGITEHLAPEFVPRLRHVPYSRSARFRAPAAACKFGAGMMPLGIAAAASVPGSALGRSPISTTAADRDLGRRAC